jgi:hypothetical protein
MIDGVWSGNRINLSTENYGSLTELHTPKIAVTAAQCSD